MNRTLTNFLIDLVKGLSKSEKKHFQLYAKRNIKKRELKFLQLFDFIDKTTDVTKEDISKNFSDLTSSQLTDLKGRLYDNLLISLRHLNRHETEFSIREQIDCSAVLYSKGLYAQSLAILVKAKKMAQQANKDVLLFEIIEFEKIIEARHVTKDFSNRFERLTEEADNLNLSIATQGKLSNLAAKFTGTFTKSGHVKNMEELNQVKALFDNNSSLVLNDEPLSFFGKVTLYHACGTFHYNCMNFKRANLFAHKFVSLFEEEPVFMKTETELYLTAMANYLRVLFLGKDYDRFEKYFNQLKQFVEENEQTFGKNLRLRAFHFIETAQFNLFFMEGNYDEGVTFVDGFLNRLEEYQLTITQHKVFSLELNFKVALMYFGAGDYKNAIKYLNAIVNAEDNDYRVDIQSFARVILLTAHFELGNTEFISYELKSVSRFLEKNNENQKIPAMILEFLNANMYSDKNQLKAAYSEFYYNLLDNINDVFGTRMLLYFDLLIWVESKIQDVSMQKIMRDKFLQKFNENELFKNSILSVA